ncbi:MAG: EVE domain-containing protein [Dehalococcoidales bacterium]|nr:EVE domain-containing protein [Dehalococcoidales bacterium]
MSNYWLAVGSRRNWETALAHGNIWGLKDTQRHMWERIQKGDVLLFYSTRPVGGIIGHGVVQTTFRQNRPLWPDERRKGTVIWPLRIEFDVLFCWPPDRWVMDRLVSSDIWPRAGFQMLNADIGNSLVSLVGGSQYILEAPRIPSVAEPSAGYEVDPAKPDSAAVSHSDMKKILVEIGRLQKFIAEEEYAFDIGRLDVVWRRVELSVPTYVFEIQLGGDIYHALAKLKHAFDLWNSQIFIVAPDEQRSKVGALLSGTFHEIDDHATFLETGKMQELYRRKRAYYDLERELGI